MEAPKESLEKKIFFLKSMTKLEDLTVFLVYGHWTTWMSSSQAASPLAQVELLPIGTLACLVLVYGRPFASLS
jgi:hypothetical protein